MAAVTAAVMAGAPALAGNTAASATPSPVVVSGFKNGPVLVTGNGLTTIATMHVPAGKWTISGKAWAINGGSVFLEVDCRLVAGASSDSSRPVVGPNGQQVSAATLAFNVSHTFRTAGTVTMKCNSFGVSLQVSEIKITAIKAGKLTSSRLS